MKKWNVASVRASKGLEKLGCCTAYDACFARLADLAGVMRPYLSADEGCRSMGDLVY